MEAEQAISNILNCRKGGKRPWLLRRLGLQKLSEPLRRSPNDARFELQAHVARALVEAHLNRVRAEARAVLTTLGEQTSHQPASLGRSEHRFQILGVLLLAILNARALLFELARVVGGNSLSLVCHAVSST